MCTRVGGSVGVRGVWVWVGGGGGVSWCVHR